ncbi:tetratricopeptide repeat domain 27 [Coprinellus micaceus]|uniref:Tetratricopeptide repeat domain 27 n=1 Tax=Coprinellus micaceus TaxID=71717 RepID=A0A4Y7SPR5_COPMI|nr:tetratricopeptide repeat domain 27 [Coprinellus micaceus]
MALSAIEKALLQGKWNPELDCAPSPVAELAKQAVEGDFRAVLTSSFARTLFTLSSPNFTKSLREIFDLSKDLHQDSATGELIRLCIAITCLHAYVQVNWTGPDLNVTPLEVIPVESSITPTEQGLDAKAIEELAYGGEPAYHLAKYPTFLRLSQLLLDVPFTYTPSVTWWKLRATMLHHRTLDEPVAHTLSYEDDLDALGSIIADDSNLSGRLILERGLLQHLFSQDRSALEYFVNAARATRMDYELTGALGRRTKFQADDKSQLVLLAESHLEADEEDTKQGDGTSPSELSPDQTNGLADGESKMPETLALNDDTLLEQTEFTSSRPTDANSSRLSHIDVNNQPALHPLDQCILLSLCLNVKNTMPAHGLTNEQMAPYVFRVISHPRNWSVHTMALLLRSRLESQRTRTVERSTFQLQALIDQMPTADSTLRERLVYFHSIPLPSKWEMERELALRYMSLGVVKSALEIFERLEMWEDVVQCYASLNKSDKGVTVVRDLLEGRRAEVDVVLSRGKEVSEKHRATQDATREAKLWCLLGDLDPDHGPEHYRKAWSISKASSGRAMRSLGGYYFARGEWTDAVECLKRAVAIHPLVVRPWFIMGCACIQLEDWETARDAFTRCVAIDPEDGESWSNLASMYLRLDEEPSKEKKNVDEDDSGKNEATDAAVPFSNKLRAMWYNYMIVAMDVGELSESCRAMGRVVEMQAEKQGTSAVDEDVLERLVDAVTRASPNPDEAQQAGGAQNDAANPNEGHGLSKQVINLFDKTVLSRVSTPRIFRAYGRLQKWQSKWGDATKAYMDAYRCGVAGTMEKGETDVKKWKEAVTEVEDIVDILRNFGPKVGEFNKYKWRPQARSIVRSFMARTKDFEDEPEWERLADLQEELKKVEEE